MENTLGRLGTPTALLVRPARKGPIMRHFMPLMAAGSKAAWAADGRGRSGRSARALAARTMASVGRRSEDTTDLGAAGRCREFACRPSGVQPARRAIARLACL